MAQLQDMESLCEDLLASVRSDASWLAFRGRLKNVFQKLKNWCLAHKDLIAKMLIAGGSVMKLHAHPNMKFGGEIVITLGNCLQSLPSPTLQLSHEEQLPSPSSARLVLIIRLLVIGLQIQSDYCPCR